MIYLALHFKDYEPNMLLLWITIQVFCALCLLLRVFQYELSGSSVEKNTDHELFLDSFVCLNRVPAHLPDTRQLSRATPARSSA